MTRRKSKFSLNLLTTYPLPPLQNYSLKKKYHRVHGWNRNERSKQRKGTCI